ncbi:hypothetical protein VB618_18155 [Microvirga sp. CF3062]|uniref:hypothetical protein n=1 Tax=Microvirga sp. CF3062 TaxID=3110182 RepID=UPI002E762F9E|nr:hypothetical protein [Microvirga sp. CF3062]MEE1658127.1 hypothetical protein [Microvirga sp. CF3062]
MAVFLLNVMGSAAVASAVIVGIIATQLSREIAHANDTHLEHSKQKRRAID